MLNQGSSSAPARGSQVARSTAGGFSQQSQSPKFTQEVVQQVGVGAGNQNRFSTNNKQDASKPLAMGSKTSSDFLRVQSAGSSNRAMTPGEVQPNLKANSQMNSVQRRTLGANSEHAGSPFLRQQKLERLNNMKNGKKQEPARTGMPPNIKQNLLAGESGKSQDLRQMQQKFSEKIDAPQVLTGGKMNGQGMWVHQTSTSRFGGQSNDSGNGSNLPPIARPPRSGSQKVPSIIDQKAEKGLVGVLEKKYQEAIQEADVATMKAEKATFDLDVAKRQRADIHMELMNLQDDFTKIQEMYQKSEAKASDREQRFNTAQQEKDKMEVKIQEERVLMQRLERQLDFERECRQQDEQRFDADVKDLQEHIVEYEEETMSLQHQLYEAKQNKQSSPSKMDRSPGPSVNNSKMGESPNRSRIEHDQKSQISQSEIAERNKFQQVFGESNEEAEKRISQLQTKLSKALKDVRREEEHRKTFQEAARKKDEELKARSEEIKVLEVKLQEELSTKQREKKIIMQKDNKITVLEAKLSELEGKGPKKGGVKSGSGLNKKEEKTTPVRQKEIFKGDAGRIVKNVKDAEKQVVNSVAKPKSGSQSKRGTTPQTKEKIDPYDIENSAFGQMVNSISNNQPTTKPPAAKPVQQKQQQSRLFGADEELPVHRLPPPPAKQVSAEQRSDSEQPVDNNYPVLDVRQYLSKNKQETNNLNASKGGRKPAFDYDSLEEGAPHESDSSDENHQLVPNSPKKSVLKSSSLKSSSPKHKPNGTSVSFHISQQDQPPPIQENEDESDDMDGSEEDDPIQESGDQEIVVPVKAGGKFLFGNIE